MGNLARVWIGVPRGLAERELKGEFRARFGVKWAEVLDAADTSFAYNAANDTYFAVRDLHPVADLSLEALLKKNGSTRVPNILIS